jgi:hypothetical protein
MENTYGEFQGTDLDPAVDYDFDEFDEEEGNDLLPILGASALVAAVVGGVLVMVGRRHNPTPQDRIEDAIATVQKGGKKGTKALAGVVDDTRLDDLLAEALDRAGKLARDAGGAARDAKVGDVLEDALSRSRKAVSRLELADVAGDVSKNVRKGVRRGIRKAKKDIDLNASLDDVVKRARKASGQVDLDELIQAVRNRAEEAVSAVGEADVDRETAEHVIDAIRERVDQALETLREDVAPKAVDTFQSSVMPVARGAAGTVSRRVREDVLPAAQEVLGKVRSDVLPAAQERAAKLDDEYHLSDRARKAADVAGNRAGSLTDMLRALGLAILSKVLDEVLPEARKAGSKAVKLTREEVIPTATQTAQDVAQRVQEDVLPKVGEVAAQTPDVLADVLKMARERVGQAIDVSQPVVSDAVEYSQHRAGETLEFAQHRAAEAAEMARKRGKAAASAVRDSKDGVGGALSTAGHGVKGAVSATVDATTYVTKETTGILFWLAMLGALIMLVFVPDREKQKEMWNSVMQFTGEVREMWRDLQGVDYELDVPEDNSTL